MVDTINAMGNMGVAMGSGELYSALQQGVIDGICTTPQMLHSISRQHLKQPKTSHKMKGLNDGRE